MLNRNTAGFSNNINSFVRIGQMKNSSNTKKIKKTHTKKNDDDYLSKSEFDSLTVIGQFDKKFIVTMNMKNKSIIMLDQHAVHERILYELYTKLFFSEVENHLKLKKSVNQSIFHNVFSTQKLKRPINLEIKLEKNIPKSLLDSYCLFNFEFKILSFQLDTLSLIVYSVPVILDRVIEEENLKEIIEKLFKNNLQEEIKDKEKAQFYLKDMFLDVIKSKACRNAVKFNDILTIDVMNTLIFNLKKFLNTVILLPPKKAKILKKWKMTTSFTVALLITQTNVSCQEAD